MTVAQPHLQLKLRTHVQPWSRKEAAGTLRVGQGSGVGRVRPSSCTPCRVCWTFLGVLAGPQPRALGSREPCPDSTDGVMTWGPKEGWQGYGSGASPPAQTLSTCCHHFLRTRRHALKSWFSLLCLFGQFHNSLCFDFLTWSSGEKTHLLNCCEP